MPIPLATQTLILTQVGDTPQGTCAALISAIWDDYADVAVVHPRLQRYYTQRECIDMLLGTLREQIDAGLQGDLELKASQKISNLQAQRAACQDVIDRIEAQQRAGRSPVTGVLSTSEIGTPPTVGDVVADVLAVPDGWDSRYRGDTYKPLRGWPWPYR